MAVPSMAPRPARLFPIPTQGSAEVMAWVLSTVIWTAWSPSLLTAQHVVHSGSCSTLLGWDHLPPACSQGWRTLGKATVAAQLPQIGWKRSWVKWKRERVLVGSTRIPFGLKWNQRCWARCVFIGFITIWLFFCEVLGFICAGIWIQWFLEQRIIPNIHHPCFYWRRHFSTPDTETAVHSSQPDRGDHKDSGWDAVKPRLSLSQEKQPLVKKHVP